MTALTDDEFALLENACRLTSYHYMQALDNDPKAAATYAKTRGKLDRIGMAGDPDLAHRLFHFIWHNGLNTQKLPDYYDEAEWQRKVDTHHRRTAELLRVKRQKLFGAPDPIALGKSRVFPESPRSSRVGNKVVPSEWMFNLLRHAPHCECGLDTPIDRRWRFRST